VFSDHAGFWTNVCPNTTAHMRRVYRLWIAVFVLACVSILLIRAAAAQRAPAASQDASEFYDSHVHLTNYIQEGTDIREFLKIMGTRVGRSVLFGIPLQQEWSYRVNADNAPTYYLSTDSPLYYYSFNDAFIAMAYKSLTPDEQARFDPMITGFNPADMYAADHIRRVLRTFPGVFEGIGEFTIHKEFVSSKIAGSVASLLDPALDRVLSLAEEIGLVVIIHNDVDTPFAKPESTPAYLKQMQDLLRRHPGADVIWAHTGLGRVVHPIENHAAMLDSMLHDPAYSHVYFDISWDEVAKYMTANPKALKIAADLFNKHPDRFLFGTDALAPPNSAAYFKTFDDYGPLWPLLTKETSLKIRKENYKRIFDMARQRVRAWEGAHTN
jgi:predicted TIM-barrel fold metal-dependent hydrolase